MGTRRGLVPGCDGTGQCRREMLVFLFPSARVYLGSFFIEYNFARERRGEAKDTVARLDI